MDIRYPIGRGELEGEITPERRLEWIKDLEDAPGNLREAVSGLSEEQLDTPYRDGGWTVRQIVHHLCDSNINSYVRFKLAVTEDSPVINTWEQTPWAELDDAVSACRGLTCLVGSLACSLGHVPAFVKGEGFYSYFYAP